MNIVHQKKLLFIGSIFFGFSVSVILAVSALSENINLFYTPTQIKNSEAPINKIIRAGGIVLKGSLIRIEELKVSFIVTDYNDNLTIKYEGLLPDLFKEEQGVVVLGKLNENGELIAEQVLAKHDENYMPPEISDLIK